MIYEKLLRRKLKNVYTSDFFICKQRGNSSLTIGISLKEITEIFFS